jgi:hypothetical protein
MFPPVSQSPFFKPLTASQGKKLPLKRVALQSAVKHQPISLPLLAFTTASVMVTLSMFRNAMQGHVDKNNVLNNAAHNKAYFLNQSSNWGTYSGYPLLDKLSSSLTTLKLQGPYNYLLKWDTFKQNKTSFFPDVFFPNLIPLGISTVALYATLGPGRVHHVFGLAGSAVSSGSAAVWRTFKGNILTARHAQKAGSGIAKVGLLPFKSLKNLGIVTGTLFGGAYLLDKFMDVVNGTEQQRYFRDFVLGNGLYGETGPY